MARMGVELGMWMHVSWSMLVVSVGPGNDRDSKLRGCRCLAGRRAQNVTADTEDRLADRMKWSEVKGLSSHGCESTARDGLSRQVRSE